MATIEKFKQINAFINRASKAPNAGHLSWMKKFKERMQTLIVTSLGQDCPAMVSDVYTRLSAAVQTEDDCYRIITRSPLTEQIAQADTTRDNTFIGLKTMVEALSRVGTAAQKDAAPRVLQAIRDYQVSTTENYELESTHIEQLIQVLEINPLSADCATLGITALVAQLKSENQQVQALISQRSEEQAGIDASALPRARQATDLLYVEAVMIINAHAISQWEQGESPYDYAISVINEDEDYYAQHVFPRGVKKVKISTNIYFSFYSGETWLEALDEELDSNDGWTASEDNEMFYRGRRLLDKQGAPVDATTKVDDTKQYQLEAEAQPAPQPDDQGGGDVTPVTPEA